MCCPLSNVILYTRKGCHLCDDALLILTKYGIRPQIVDIDTDAELVRLYNTCVPVVTIDGKVRFRGKINEILVRRLWSHD